MIFALMLVEAAAILGLMVSMLKTLRDLERSHERIVALKVESERSRCFMIVERYRLDAKSPETEQALWCVRNAVRNEEVEP